VKRVCDLKKHDHGVVVLVAEHDALTEAAHTMVCVVSLQALQSFLDRRILLGLCIFHTDCVPAHGIDANGWRLVSIEGKRDDWTAPGELKTRFSRDDMNIRISAFQEVRRVGRHLV
jgi:hypothetical protein